MRTVSVFPTWTPSRTPLLTEMRHTVNSDGNSDTSGGTQLRSARVTRIRYSYLFPIKGTGRMLGCYFCNLEGIYMRSWTLKRTHHIQHSKQSQSSLRQLHVFGCYELIPIFYYF